MQKKIISTLFLVLVSLVINQTNAEDLKRRASWEAKFSKQNGIGYAVKSLITGSPLEHIGVEVGDTLLSVDGNAITDSETWYDINDNLTADHLYSLVFRKQKDLSVATYSIRFKPLPMESYPGLEVFYESFTSDYGIKQRAIITKPKNLSKSAAVIVLQGLSCSSIEKVPNRNNNYMRLLTDIVKESNMVVMRIEKPGVGDSEGYCSKTDFKTELNGYEVALQKFLQKSYVDKNKVIVYGNSMGSALAPYIANKYNLAGVISDGTYMRTWFEHMLEIERRIKKMQGETESQITKKMNEAYIPLYYGMLIDKRSYGDIIKENPLLSKYNYHGLNHMYGRPMSFYHQLQEFDISGEWEKIKVPVRIRWGTNDWIMSEYDNDLIIEVLEQAGHKDYKLVKFKGLDHWSTIHKNAANSFKGEKGAWKSEISLQITDWMKELTQ